MKTVYEMGLKLKNKQISSEEVVKYYITRYQEREPKVKAFLQFDDQAAIRAARQVDDLRQKQELPFLAGIPIGIKDNICTKGIRTSCGSKMLDHYYPPYDATVIDKINQNKMILFGKLNMDEFAMGSSTENSAFQITTNPHDSQCVPGGSSGGSAAAVAAEMVPLALGSDTGGSIRQPAGLCGVVGLKPTYGRVSRYGLVAFASSLDQIGPLANNVKDCALLFHAISGHDAKDSTSAKVETTDFTIDLEKPLTGKVIGLPQEFFGNGIQASVKQAVLAAAQKYQQLGAKIQEVHFQVADWALPAYYIISSAEASSNLARYDGIKYGYRTPEFKDLQELYQKSRDEGFGDEVKRRIMLGTYVLSAGYYDAYYKKAQQVRTLVMNEFKRLFEQCDVLLTPTSPTTAFKIGAQKEDPIAMYANDICTVPVNIAGVPAISLNCGWDEQGLPIGMQLIGKNFAEAELFHFAHQYEMQAQNNR